MSVWRWSEMKAQAMKLFLHDICCHDIQWVWRLIIGWHFTEIWVFYYYYHLDYGHLTYSSVQCFPFINLFVAPIKISKLTATNRFSKRIIHGWINCELHVSKLKCKIKNVFLHECIFEKYWASSKKLRCHFHFVFPAMPDKVAFERITLITAVTEKPLYFPLNSASCWHRINLHLQVCGKHWCLSANINKKHASELFWEGA